MFCIKCGSPAAAGHFCKDCFLEREELFQIGNFRLTRCPICESFYKGPSKMELVDTIKDNIKTSNKINKIRVSYRKKGNHIIANVECDGIVKPFSKTERKIADIIVDTKQCDDCTKLSGNYYEAVLQVRGPDKERIMKEIEGVNALSYIREAHGGFDVRFVRKQDAIKTVNMLRHCSIKRTFKLVGEKKGKKLYRASYSVR